MANIYVIVGDDGDIVAHWATKQAAREVSEELARHASEWVVDAGRLDDAVVIRCESVASALDAVACYARTMNADSGPVFHTPA